MLRGFFRRADGLSLPNNVTLFGAQTILVAALRDTATEFWLGLVNCVPDRTLQLEDLNEPEFGTGGYARQQITRDIMGWPVLSTLNDEPFVQSEWVTFPATDAWSGPVNRPALFTTDTDRFGDGVIALGSAWSPETLYDESSVDNTRTFRYRLFLR